MLPPETRGWCTSGTYELADKVYREVVGIFRRHGAKWGLSILKCGDTPNTQQTLLLSNGSWICTKSADHPDSLDAEGLDFAVDDEAAKHPAKILHQHLIPRLTDRRGELFAISTARGRNWFFDQWTDADSGVDPEWAAFRAPSSGNPHVFQLGVKDPEWLRLRAQYERAKMLPLFEQEFGGSFAHLAGRVWASWDPKVHVRPLDECASGVEEWRIVADWGLRVTCMLVIGRTKAGQYRCVDEVYRGGMLPAERRSEALRLAVKWGIKRGWGDPADPTSNENLNDAGLLISPADNDRDGGILIVAGKFGEDGGIKIAEDACPNLCREVENWVWRDDTKAREIQEPVKKDDHACDAWRYGVVSWERMIGEGEVTPNRVVYSGKGTPDLGLFAIR
jgi:hypothetical protein